MSEPSERQLPDDLEHLTAQLRANRGQADPPELDQIKRTVLARNSIQRQGGFGFMKSRVTTGLSLVALVVGTGGAIAIGASGSPGGPQGGAASAQYCNGKAEKCQPKPKHNCGRYHHQLCPTKPKRCYFYTPHNHRHSYDCSAGEKAGSGLRHKSRKGSKKGHVKAISVKRSDPSTLTG